MNEMGIHPDKRVYNGIIDALGEFGQSEDAVKVFEQMLHRGLKPDIGTWNALIKWHCKRGDVKGPVHFFGEMQEQGLYPKIFLTIISHLGEQGKWDMIWRLSDYMRKKGE
jgi:pentatricopeptide repeat protein